MKVSKEHYEQLKAVIAGAVRDKSKACFIDYYAALKDCPTVKDVARRFRWDCLWAGLNWQRQVPDRGTCNLIEWGYKDDHFDTALRKIMKELELPQ